MKLSREKINHLANCIINDFDKRDEVDYIADPIDVRIKIVEIITDTLSIDDEVDNIVRKKLSSLSRKVIEDSNEWDVMYAKYYEEEMNKKN
jgi:hypothetical protein